MTDKIYLKYSSEAWQKDRPRLDPGDQTKAAPEVSNLSGFLKNRIIDLNIVLQFVNCDRESKRLKREAHVKRHLYSINLSVVT